ncbi:MAG: hypothetical protein WCC60_24405 [Ilumatobacteraceae bacterium]
MTFVGYRDVARVGAGGLSNLFATASDDGTSIVWNTADLVGGASLAC